MIAVRARLALPLCLCAALACTPKGPAPSQCTTDSNCFTGGVCNAGGTCVTGSKVDAAKSTIEIDQTQAIANGNDEVSITVTLKDAAGNALTSRGVKFLVTPSDGTTLTTTGLSTNSVGQVTAKLVSTKAGAKTITAIGGTVNGGSDGVALQAAAQVTFSADGSNLAPVAGPGADGGAGGSTLTITNADGTTPPDVQADGQSAIDINLTLLDANGNAVAGAPVFLTASGSGNTFTPAHGQTDANGKFSATLTSTIAQVETVTIVIGNLAPISSQVTFHAGPADVHQSTATIDVSTLPADGTSLANITVIARDAQGNPEPNATVWIDYPTDESGNTLVLSSAQQAAQQAGQQQEPLLTQPDGSVAVQFMSVKAEVKSIQVHIDTAEIDLPLTVTAGPPSPTFSVMAAIGNLDGSPIVADDNNSYFAGVYIADQFDNPISGIVVTFTTDDPKADLENGTDSSPPNSTDDSGQSAVFYGTTLAGTHTVTAHGGPAFIDGQTTQAVFVPGPPTVANSTLTLSVPTITADPGSTTHVTIQLADANGNPTPDQNLGLDALDATSASCAPCTFTNPVDDKNGTYETDLSSSKAQTLTVSAQVDIWSSLAAPNTLTQTLTVTAGAPSATSSTLTATVPTTLGIDDQATPTALLTLVDAQGNPVIGTTPTCAVTPVTGNTPASGCTVSGATNSSGQATLSFRTTKAETKTLAVTSPTVGATVQFTMQAGAPDASHTSFSANPVTFSTDNTDGTTLTITVLDTHGNPVPGFPLTSLTDSPAHGTFNPAAGWVTDANGVIAVNYKSTFAASETITAAGANFSKSVSLSVQAGAASSANSSMTFNGNGAVTAGGALGFSVTEKDGANNPILGHTITLNCGAGITIAPATLTTGTSGAGAGVVSGTVTGTKAGTYQCSAADAGVAFAQASFTINPSSTPGSTAGAQVLAVAPTSIASGDATGATISLQVQDQFGNNIPGLTAAFASDSGVTITCIAACATGANGVATAQVTGRVSGAHTITSTLASATRTATLSVTPGAAHHLSFIVQPTNVAASAAINNPTGFQVRIEDAQGNLVPTASAAVSLVILNAASGGTVSNGTLAGNSQGVATAGGVASFTNVSISSVSGSPGPCSSNGVGPPCRALQANATGLVSAQSNFFTVTPPNYSSGSDGPLHVSGAGMSLPAKTYNYTTITIDAGATLRSDGNGVLKLLAQGDVTVNGVVDVSGSAGGSAGGTGNNGGGAGGGEGASANGAGAAGRLFTGAGTRAAGGSTSIAPPSYATAGLTGGGTLGGTGGGAIGGGGAGGGADQNLDEDSGGGGGGGGAAGGAGGFGGADGCVAGGGAGGGQFGGNNPGGVGCGASAAGGGAGCPAYAGGTGAIGSSPCTPLAGSGGGGSIGCDAASDLPMATTLRPGSGGGGGGSGGDENGESASGGGGGGGGGGGALYVNSGTAILVNASGHILANGGIGGNGAVSTDDCNDDSGGGGGGGSGGAIFLSAPKLVVASGASVSAGGGAGGAAGATAAAGNGGNGGLGRVRLSLDPSQSSLASGAISPPPVNGTTASPATAGKAFVALYPQ